MNSGNSLSVDGTIVLCAGGINYANLPISTSQSNAMVPVNGKPVIGWILDDLLQKQIKCVTVVLREEDQRLAAFLQRAYSDRMDILQVPIPAGGSIVHSLQAGLQKLSNSGVVRVLLGDTLVRDSFQANFDFVYTGLVEDSRRWCLAVLGQDGHVTDYVDKKEFQFPEKVALVGYYHFQKGDFLLACVNECLHNKEHELSDVLKRYGQQYPIRALSANEWHDFGHIENLLIARRRLLQSRFFNSLTINPVLNTITKISDHNQKLEDELDWYLALPAEMQVLTPRILRHEQINDRLHIVQEYYGYPTLAELYVYGEIPSDAWASILRQIMRVHDEFKRYPSTLNQDEIYDMYMDKTRQRLEMLGEQGQDWELRLKQKDIIFNERKLQNILELLPTLEEQIRQLVMSTNVCIVHGDFCFSNILFDVNNQIIRLIDPRGRFGRKGIYGDPRYDIAKLRHSISGQYDFIMADMFTIEEDAPGVFAGRIFSNGVQEHVAEYFDHLLERDGYLSREIRLIEGLLFISMLPYHNDHPRRQQMLYVTGLNLLNEVLACAS